MPAELRTEERPKSALRREDLPTLLRPRKATSGCEEGGKERKCAALKRRLGSEAQKKWEAYLRWVEEGGRETL